MVRYTHTISLPPTIHRIETLTFPVGAALPASYAAARAWSSLPKLAHESRFHMQVRLRRPKQFEKLARTQSPVYAESEESRVLSSHVGGETI